MARLKLKTPRLARTEFTRRAEEYLKDIQKKLMPEHARDVVAINMETGEYVVGRTSGEVFEASSERWPNAFTYICRVDGGPSTKFR